MISFVSFGSLGKIGSLGSIGSIDSLVSLASLVSYINHGIHGSLAIARGLVSLQNIKIKKLFRGFAERNFIQGLY